MRAYGRFCTDSAVRKDLERFQCEDERAHTALRPLYLFQKWRQEPSVQHRDSICPDMGSWFRYEGANGLARVNSPRMSLQEGHGF